MIANLSDWLWLVPTLVTAILIWFGFVWASRIPPLGPDAGLAFMLCAISRLLLPVIASLLVWFIYAYVVHHYAAG